jgi:hypothetical protein
MPDRTLWKQTSEQRAGRPPIPGSTVHLALPDSETRIVAFGAKPACLTISRVAHWRSFARRGATRVEGYSRSKSWTEAMHSAATPGHSTRVRALKWAFASWTAFLVGCRVLRRRPSNGCSIDRRDSKHEHLFLRGRSTGPRRSMDPTQQASLAESQLLVGKHSLIAARQAATDDLSRNSTPRAWPGSRHEEPRS